jgi:hypothetical protein
MSAASSVEKRIRQTAWRIQSLLRNSDSPGAGASEDKISIGGGILRTCSDRPWGPPSLLYEGYRVSFPGLKRPWRGVNHPLPSSAKVKERVELYNYSHSGPSWLLPGRTLLYMYTIKVMMMIMMMMILTTC